MANKINLRNPYHRYGQILKTTFVCLVFCAIFPPIFSQEKNNGIDKILDNTLVKEGAVTTDYIHLYQRVLSKNLGGSCPMYPSCSNYGLIVFNERPFWEAMSLTADRLVRCGHEDKYYEQTYAYGKSSLLDYPPYRTPPHKLIYHSPEYLYTDNLHLQDSAQMFVNHLINQNKYDLALLEIERVIYFQTNDTNYYVKKLLCYDALDREEEGILDYEQNFPSKIKTNEEVLLKLAKLYYNTGNYAQSMSTLKSNVFQLTNNKYKSLVLQGVIQVQNQDYVDAKSLFKQSSLYSVDTIFNTNIQIIERLQNIKMKSANTAKLLSIIPGGGYAFTKNYQNAITSLLINSLLGYATYNSIKKENYGVAAIMGVFSVSFYIGNIFGAGQSADRYNQRIINQGVNKLNITNQYINY
ncbi:putative membrane protein insertion efficiency factor [termite gut metagenome]|uniref:Putative membrane protein insertion efficiency factor n=1 Tax=termite gut metagenome TaxID=433724 RepID=A0A5J4SJ09_9ZZZZ